MTTEPERGTLASVPVEQWRLPSRKCNEGNHYACPRCACDCHPPYPVQMLSDGWKPQ